jgi:CRISPR/Cas system-associated endoribonuclease Cas2
MIVYDINTIRIHISSSRTRETSHSLQKNVLLRNQHSVCKFKKLEDELGVKLFNRNAKPIALTQIGTKILSQAKIIIEEAKANG